MALLLLVLLMGGFFVFKSLFQPPPPKPLSTAAVPQVAPSQVVNPTPNQERVDIEMNNAAPAGLQVQTFEATPNPVRPGQRVTLSWAVAGASAVSITPAIGTVPPQGSREFNARSNVQFVLVAKSADGQTVSKTLDIQVDRGAANRPQQETSNAPPQQPPPSVQTPQQQTQSPPPETQTAQAPPPPVPQKQVRASPVMNLFHDHGVAVGTGVPWPRCWGQLQIGGGRVVYHVLGTSDGRRDDFVAPVSAITDVRVNMIPIRGHPAFHMRVNGQVFNFIPAAGAPVVYVNVISQWLQAR